MYRKYGKKIKIFYYFLLIFGIVNFFIISGFISNGLRDYFGNRNCKYILGLIDYKHNKEKFKNFVSEFLLNAKSFSKLEKEDYYIKAKDVKNKTIETGEILNNIREALYNKKDYDYKNLENFILDDIGKNRWRRNEKILYYKVKIKVK